MARINKGALARQEIIEVALHYFLEDGYSNTKMRTICSELKMSSGNTAFYFRTKEHMLAELIDMLCTFQWKLMKEEANDGISSIMAICLELTAMATMCEDDEIAKDIYVSAYTSPLCLEIIRKNDMERAKQVFKEYCPDWSDEQYAEAELLVSGIEYVTLMPTGLNVPLETRLAGALNQILGIYNVPEEMRKMKIAKVFAMDYRSIGKRVLQEFKEYVAVENDRIIQEMIGR